MLAGVEGRDAEGAAPPSFLDLFRWRRKLPIGAEPRTFGERFRAHQLERGLSQEAAGRCLGVGWATVARWERGECRPGQRCEPALVRFLQREEREGGQDASK